MERLTTHVKSTVSLGIATNGTMKYRRSRAQQKKLLLEQGCEFFEGKPKHRYVGIYGDRRMKRVLQRALQWEVLSYPKRQPSVTIEVPQPDGFDFAILSSQPQNA